MHVTRGRRGSERREAAAVLRESTPAGGLASWRAGRVRRRCFGPPASRFVRAATRREKPRCRRRIFDVPDMKLKFPGSSPCRVGGQPNAPEQRAKTGMCRRSSTGLQAMAKNFVHKMETKLAPRQGRDAVVVGQVEPGRDHPAGRGRPAPSRVADAPGSHGAVLRRQRHGQAIAAAAGRIQRLRGPGRTVAFREGGRGTGRATGIEGTSCSIPR